MTWLGDPPQMQGTIVNTEGYIARLLEGTFVPYSHSRRGKQVCEKEDLSRITQLSRGGQGLRSPDSCYQVLGLKDPTGWGHGNSIGLDARGTWR